MTPREFYREQDAAEERASLDDMRAVAAAWHTAAFAAAAFVGKLPDLRDVLARISKKRRSPEEVRLEAALLAERMGVPMKPISEAAKRALLKLQREKSKRG